MYLSAESPTRSVRSQPVDDGQLLLIGGEGHKAGQDPDEAERYRRLESSGSDRYAVDRYEYHWSTQDRLPADGFPTSAGSRAARGRCGQPPATASGA